MTKKSDAFLFLGTGAADWDEMDSSEDARKFSSMLAYGELLFDCPAHVPQTMEKLKIQLSAVKYLLITHSHQDHLNIEALKLINQSRKNESQKPVSIFAHAAVADYLKENNIEATGIVPEQTFVIGDYHITCLLANHTPGLKDETAIHYLVDKKGFSWLYATDGAWLPYAAWKIIQNHQLDAIIIDATIGDNHEDDYRIFEHNSLPMIRLMIAAMHNSKCLKPAAPVILTHLARTLHPNHQDLIKTVSKPYIVAFDGMEY